eukprot:5241292-Amphidinium_carterae.1
MKSHTEDRVHTFLHSSTYFFDSNSHCKDPSEKLWALHEASNHTVRNESNDLNVDTVGKLFLSLQHGGAKSLELLRTDCSLIAPFAGLVASDMAG